MKVGFYGHVRQYHNIKEEIDANIQQVLESGKYVMRFDTGLPTKTYLYSHPYPGSEDSGSSRPVDEDGRHLKSIKPIKAHKP